MAINFYSGLRNHGSISTHKDVVTVEYLEKKLSQKLKDPVRVATITDLDATYNPTDMTLTANNPGYLIVDNITLLQNDRILVKDQLDKTQNGIYILTTVGNTSTAFILTRANDFNATEKIIHNININVMEGDAQADITFMLTNDGSIILDSTPLIFQRHPDLTNMGSVKKHEQTINGDGTTKAFTITHNLNTKAITVTMLDNDNNICIADIKILNANAVEISFDNAPSNLDNYYVNIQG